ncbi:hypothetical protein U1Q18_038958, partial [Sarracenia purpurea var. burkii]
MGTGAKTEASDSGIGVVASTAMTMYTAKEFHLQMPPFSLYVMKEAESERERSTTPLCEGERGTEQG